MIFLLLWLFLFLLLWVVVQKTPYGKSTAQVIRRFFRGRKRSIVFFVGILIFLFAGIFSVQTVHISSEDNFFPKRSFALDTIRAGALEGLVQFDSLPEFFPELASIVPTAVFTLREISKKEIIPQLGVNTPREIYFQILDKGSFRNRGIRTRKLLQKRLGKDYLVSFEESGRGKFLAVAYLGKPWDDERILSLPFALAARKRKCPPEDLMAFFSALEFHGERKKLSPDSLSLIFSEAIGGTSNKREAFRQAFFTLFPNRLDSADANILAENAIRFSEYYKKYGLTSPNEESKTEAPDEAPID